MLKKILLAVCLMASLSPLVPCLADNASMDEAINGLNKTAGAVSAFKEQSQGNTVYDANFLTTKAGKIIGLVLSFIGVLFLILMIYAGILWMTASGNDQQVTKAKGLIINSVIGMIIVFAAYAITNFIGTEIIK